MTHPSPQMSVVRKSPLDLNYISEICFLRMKGMIILSGVEFGK